MSESEWKTSLSAAVEAAIGLNVDCGGAAGVYRVRDAVLKGITPHIDAAYQRGLMAGRSQAGYTTRRKSKEKPRWYHLPQLTDVPSAETPSPASSTEGEG